MGQYNYLNATNVSQLVTHIQEEILESPALVNEEALSALSFNVLTGVIYKDLQYIKLKKGNNARNYGVSDAVGGERIQVKERELIAHHSWDRLYVDIQDFREKEPFVLSAESYERDTLLNSIGVIKNETEGYAADVFSGLFWGKYVAKSKNSQQLYDGVMTIIKAEYDKTEGSEINKTVQVIATNAFADVDSTDPSSNWDEFEAWVNKMPMKLRNAKEGVIVYMSDATKTRIMDSYARTYPAVQPQNVTALTCGFMNLPNITIASHPVVGQGDMLLATTKGNFDFGIDSIDNVKARVSCEVCGSINNNLLALQIESTQGTRVRYFDAGHLYWNGKLNTLDTSILGDYQDEPEAEGTDEP